MKVLRLQDILTAPNRLNAAAHRANRNVFKAHNRTRGWLKEQTVCQQWALAITVSFATSCPHSLWVSQLCPLALLISQTAEFGFQEKKKKKKKLQWLSAELRDEAPRHEREWVEKKMEHDQITWSGPRTKSVCGPVTVIATAEGHWHGCNHVMFIVFTRNESTCRGSVN